MSFVVTVTERLRAEPDDADGGGGIGDMGDPALHNDPKGVPHRIHDGEQGRRPRAAEIEDLEPVGADGHVGAATVHGNRAVPGPRAFTRCSYCAIAMMSTMDELSPA